MGRFLTSLIAGDETGVNSTIACGIAALLVFFGITIFAAIHDPSIWTPVAWAAYAGSVGAIVAIVSGANTARCRWSSGAQSATVTSPDATTHVESKP